MYLSGFWKACSLEQLVAQGSMVKSFATSFIAYFYIALLPHFSTFQKVAIILQIPLSTIKKKKVFCLAYCYVS